jgi:hypothetical protein
MAKTLTVSSGQTFQGGVIGDGSEFSRMDVQFGGSAVGTMVQQGGLLVDEGRTSNTEIIGAEERVAAFGVADGTFVGNRGVLIVH